MPTHHRTILLLLSLGVIALTSQAAAAPPRFEGTFLQLNGAMLAWTEEQWSQELNSMRDVGLEIILIQYCGADGKAFYPSQAFEPFPGAAETDAVRTVLDQAAQRRMRVFLGLHSGWGTAEKMTEANLRMAEELLARYGDCPAFYGWYIPQEASNCPHITSPVVKTYAATAAWCHARTPGKPVGIAPYFGLQPTPEAFREAWTKILAKVKVDILMLQDGVGCDRDLTPENVVPYFAAMAEACRASNTRFWSDLEVFRIPRQWSPAPIAEVIEQLRGQQPHVQRFVIFEFSHYMSPQRGPAQRELYEGYARYLRGLVR